MHRLHWEKQAVHVAMSLTRAQPYSYTDTQPCLTRVSPPGSPKQLCDSLWLTHHDCLLFKWSNMCIRAIRHFCKRSRKRNMRRRSWLVSGPWDESAYMWRWGWFCLEALFVTRLVSSLREVSAHWGWNSLPLDVEKQSQEVWLKCFLGLLESWPAYYGIISNPWPKGFLSVS